MKVRKEEIENYKWWHQVTDGIVELLFPPQNGCPVCQQEKSSFRNGLGTHCIHKIGFIHPPICLKCGRPNRLQAVTEQFCQQCKETTYYFTAARAVGVYEGALREYLTELKYRYRPDLGEALGLLLVEWVKLHREFQESDIIIPIPIHCQKLTLRGYNQTELLANPLQRYLGIKLKNDIIIREKITESQNALSKEERFINVSGAFRVVETSLLTGASVLLVDDIFTTGATVSEVARVLLRAGALEVKVLTLARGVVDSQWFHNRSGGL